MSRQPPLSGLFRQSRIRLALTYGGVMGLMLTAGGFLFYHGVEQFRWLATDHELSQVITTLHDAIEPDLGPPGQISAAMVRELPGLQRASRVPIVETAYDDSDRLLGKPQLIHALSQSDDYIRLLDDLGQPLASVGGAPREVGWVPLAIADDYSDEHPLYRQMIIRPRGKEMPERYRQVTVALHRSDGRIWGYLQMGQSFLVVDRQLAQTRSMLLLGVPIAMVAIGMAAWWFAGMAIAPLQLAYRQIQQFTADAAHELRTPLTASRTTLDLLLDIAPLEVKGPIAVVLRQQERLGNLVQDLLLLSRLDAQEAMGQGMGQKSTQQAPGLNSDRGPIRQPINLLELLEDLQEELIGLAIAQDLTLTLEAPEVLWIWGDADRLCRLISNLIDNAINHGKTAITVRLRRRDAWAIVEVQNDGPAIAPDHQAHIFDRFYRIEGDRLHRKTGTGLGLAIAQAIALAHRSQIRLVSSPAGTTFSVALPLWRGGRQGPVASPSPVGADPGQSSAGSRPGLPSG
jgi:signal transduction histidine kinase